ncbi:hypothetical protein SCLCIDRAFT_1212897, partial [Scleroderma citrinum Foug A]
TTGVGQREDGKTVRSLSSPYPRPGLRLRQAPQGLKICTPIPYAFVYRLFSSLCRHMFFNPATLPSFPIGILLVTCVEIFRLFSTLISIHGNFLDAPSQHSSRELPEHSALVTDTCSFPETLLSFLMHSAPTCRQCI